ncbi:AraC family ligand binding domain-containing protein, partial [Phytoactinopolyspora endophytica]|uniref:AraC family ligand binding domain-containing protein n=1 Tax=Phytoactinopolyspora endophytica TaxID=1642495 RepID=UPI00197B3A9B
AADLTGVRLVRGASGEASLGRVLFSGAIPDGAGLGGPRVLDVYAFVFLVAGDGRYRDERGADRPLGPGSTVTVFPGLEHDYGPEPGGRWTERYVLFDGPLPHLLEQKGVLDRSRPVGKLRPVDVWLPMMEAITDPTPGG